MEEKVTRRLPLVIIIGIVAIMALILIIFWPRNNDKFAEKVAEAQLEPVLELTIDTDDPEQESVIIIVVATTENDLGIDSIILPDGSTVEKDVVEYEVTKNGKYVFKAKGANGKSVEKSITVLNVAQPSANKPYMPEGFEYKEGEVKDGYTIIDTYGNEFVWIPVETGIMLRNTTSERDYIEEEATSAELVNSVAKYYGFYIGKYEASAYDFNGEKVAASMSGKSPWTEIAFRDALNAATKMSSKFKYGEYKTSLINSYAWDTTLAWIDKSVENYSSSNSLGNYSGTIYPTGSKDSDIVNNICDMAGNVREWITERYTGKVVEDNTANTTSSATTLYRVVRGGSASIQRTAQSKVAYPESASDAYWGFRVILFK